MLIYGVSTNLRVPGKELFDFLWPKLLGISPCLPLDSVSYYRVYTFFEGGIEMEILSIGQVARRVGVGVETVRSHEREGFLEEQPGLASGYRHDPEQVL